MVGIFRGMDETVVERRRSALQEFFNARPRQMNSICKKAKVAESAVRGFLSGRTSSLQMDTYDKLAAATNVPVSLLLGESAPAGEESNHSHKSLVNHADDNLSGRADDPVESNVIWGPEAPLPPPASSMPKDVPVLGTAECGPDGVFEMNGGDAIDFVRRPPGQMGNRKLFAVYARGDSMVPMFHNSKPVYVDPNRPPEIHHAVLVEFHPKAHENPRAVIKVLSRITAEYIEVYQLNPNNIDKPFRYPRKTVKAIFRVLDFEDIMGI